MLNVSEILLEKCRRKDRRAQNELHKACYSALISVCWRYTNSNDQAVEYFNLGFVKIVMRLDKYRSSIPFELWARRVMINTIIDEYRKKKVYQEYVQTMESEELSRVDKRMNDGAEEEQEMWDFIKTGVRTLPPVMSKVFNLYAFDGYKHNEIASLLGISEGTSQWHYSMAKKKLREMAQDALKGEELSHRA